MKKILNMKLEIGINIIRAARTCPFWSCEHYYMFCKLKCLHSNQIHVFLHPTFVVGLAVLFFVAYPVKFQNWKTSNNVILSFISLFPNS